MATIVKVRVWFRPEATAPAGLEGPEEAFAAAVADTLEQAPDVLLVERDIDTTDGWRGPWLDALDEGRLALENRGLTIDDMTGDVFLGRCLVGRVMSNWREVRAAAQAAR